MEEVKCGEVKECYIKRKEKRKEFYAGYTEGKSEETKKQEAKDRKELAVKGKKYRDEPKKYRQSPTASTYYLDKLPPSDKPKMEGGFLTVLCIKCGGRYTPIYQAISSKVSAFNGTAQAAYNFYCSDTCRDSCLLFNFNSSTVDPRSKLYTESNNVRSCQTDHLKQLQRDEVGYNYCERCGDITNVELHHTQGVKANPKEAITSAGHLLLCAGCHVELHAEC